MTIEERRLLEAAAEWVDQADEPLTTETAQILARERGLDFATAALYVTLCESPRHGAFIRNVDALTAETWNFRLPKKVRLVIVPGAFYKEKPQTGGDGRLVKEVADLLGIDSEFVPLLSFGRIEQNARVLADWLGNRDDSPFVLVTHSKSSTEMRLLLAREDCPELLRKCVGWVDVSGLFPGTAVIDWLKSRPVRTFTTRLVLWWLGHPSAALEEISREACPPYPDACNRVPHMQAVHVVGFPLERHLTSPLARRGYQRLAPLGPNDSVILLGDVLLLPGLVYPIWGADHYLCPEGRDLSKLVRGILGYVFKSHAAMSVKMDAMEEEPR